MFRALLLSCLACLTACSPPEDVGSVAAEPAPATPSLALDAQDTSPPTAAQQRRTITIAADPWCPHNCIAGAAREGYMIEIAREAFALARLQVHYRNMSWARALDLADDGYIDAVVGAFTRPEAGFVYPEEAIGYAHTTLYAHTESNWTYDGIESLNEHTLVTINGYSYSPALDAYIDEYKDDPERVWILSGPAPLNRAIELLEYDRSDVLPEDRDVMRWTLERLDKQGSLRVVDRLKRVPVYIAFSEANPHSDELATLFSEGVRQLRRSGRLDQILDRYGVSWAD